jgi:hypothetical protein
MSREKLDDFLRFYAGLVVQFSTILFSAAFCLVAIMTVVKLLYNVFNTLFL